MRKTAWVLTGLMVVSAAAAMAATAPAGDMSKDKGTMAAPAGDAKMDKGMAKAKSGSVKGEVTAVDATAKTITVKGKTGDTTATWDDKTTITPKGKTSGDIKVGDSVTVWYKADGDTKTATKIAMHPMKAAKKAM
jgi:hypothetical protein